jgi:hypothetical protein
MLEKKISEFLVFGSILEYLERIVQEGDSIFGEARVLTGIDEFLLDLQALGLTVTYRASFKLQSLRDELSVSLDDATMTKGQVENPKSYNERNLADP